MGDFTRTIPVENFLEILQLVAPPCTREGVHDLPKLTQVCRFWRAVLINQPHMWSTIFATQKDRRGFVEMCLERSQGVALDVTVDACPWGRAHPGCTCDEDTRRKLLPNEYIPCEWHFTFESLATPEHSKRIRTLDIELAGTLHRIPYAERTEFALGSCQFFALSFPQLTSLGWKTGETDHANHILQLTLHSHCTLPVLRGILGRLFTQVNNLTSLRFVQCEDDINVETFRLFMLNNQSLESLSLDVVNLEGNSKAPLSIFTTSSHSASTSVPQFCRELFASPPSNTSHHFRSPWRGCRMLGSRTGCNWG